MKNYSFFTLGHGHKHTININPVVSIVADQDTIIKVVNTRPNLNKELTPRDIMFKHFGRKWSFEYGELEDTDIEYYKQVVTIDENGNFLGIRNLHQKKITSC